MKNFTEMKTDLLHAILNIRLMPNSLYLQTKNSLEQRGLQRQPLLPFSNNPQHIDSFPIYLKGIWSETNNKLKQQSMQ